MTITAKTDVSAQYLHMAAEDGQWPSKWGAASNSAISGGVRIWTRQHFFIGASDRELTFTASEDGKTERDPIVVNLRINGLSVWSVTVDPPRHPRT